MVVLFVPGSPSEEHTRLRQLWHQISIANKMSILSSERHIDVCKDGTASLVGNTKEKNSHRIDYFSEAQQG